MSKTSEILLKVTLDEQNVPEKIHWLAQGMEGMDSEAKAFFLSIFEENTKDTLKLDLWTTSFQMVEMDRFMYSTLNALAETYFKATNNKDLANELKKFAHFFGEKTEIINITESPEK